MKLDNQIFFRKEFFGGILYSALSGDYYILDNVATNNYFKLLNNVDCKKRDYIDLKRDLIENNLFNKQNTRLICNSRSNSLSAPLRVFLDITYGCNLSCLNCYTNSGNFWKNELTTNQIYSLIDQMHLNGTFLLSIAGGEPFIRKDLFKVIEYANRRYIKVSITTNGTLINESIIESINNTHIKTITISLDGNKIHHEYLRGTNHYSKVIENLKLLSKKTNSDTTIAIKTTISKVNLGDYKELISLAENIGVSVIKFNPLRLFGRAKDYKYLQINNLEYYQFLNKIRDINSSVKIIVPKTPLDDEEYNCANIGFGCTGGKESCNITPSGDFSPCAFLGDSFVVGNIKTTRFSLLWEKTSKISSFVGNETCVKCSDYKNCRGGCRSRALMEYGNANGIDPLCLRNKTDQNKLTIVEGPDGLIVYNHSKKYYKRYYSDEDIKKEYLKIYINKQYRRIKNLVNIPLKVFYDITNACNSKCIHCYNKSGNAFNGELNINEIDDLFFQVSKLGICQISLAGGEPFIRNDIMSIINKCNSYNIDVSITSNGLLIDSSLATELSKLDIKCITISIDAIDRNTYYRIRGADKFDLLLRNISFLRTLFKGELSMRMSIMNLDYQVKDIMCFAESLGFNSLKINKTHLLGRFKNNKNLYIDDNKYDEIIENFKLVKSNTINLELPREKYLNTSEKHLCSAGEKTIYVSPIGYVYPCSFIIKKKYNYGNIRNNSLEEIIHRIESFNIENEHCLNCPAMNKSHNITKRKILV